MKLQSRMRSIIIVSGSIAYTSLLKRYPIPFTVCMYLGLSGFLSIFFRRPHTFEALSSLEVNISSGIQIDGFV